jgi:ribosomal-protein-alanine N-acetyltransferase
MIRRIEPADRPAVRRLQELLPHSDPDLVDAAVEGPFLGVVAVERSQSVGYAIGLPGDPTTISELVVAPPFRRAGYGRALVEAIAANGDGSVAVLTPVENREARAFYATLGFECDGRRADFYADGSDALRLRRRE